MKYIVAIISMLFLTAPSFAQAVTGAGVAGLVGTFAGTSAVSYCLKQATKDEIYAWENTREIANFDAKPEHRTIHRHAKTPDDLQFLGSTYTLTDVYAADKITVHESEGKQSNRIIMQNCGGANPAKMAQLEIEGQEKLGYKLGQTDQRAGNDIMLEFIKKEPEAIGSSDKQFVVRYTTVNGKLYRLETETKLVGTEKQRDNARGAIYEGVRNTDPKLFAKEIKADGDCHLDKNCKPKKK